MHKAEFRSVEPSIMTMPYFAIILEITPVVATLSFNAKMDLTNLECNLKTIGTPRNGPVRGYLSIVGKLSERT